MNTALIANPTRSRQIMERIPAGRWGAPADFEGVVVFLASRASDYVCGECITVDGGWMASELSAFIECCTDAVQGKLDDCGCRRPVDVYTCTMTQTLLQLGQILLPHVRSRSQHARRGHVEYPALGIRHAITSADRAGLNYVNNC
jgi:hypothetical protein